MHPCLQISELQVHIFEYCKVDGLRALAALARTCRAFYEPALDILWRELDNVSPLIKCLPNASWIEVQSFTPEDVPVITLQLTGAPSSAQWHKIHAHASRVQKLTFCYQQYTDSGAIYRVSWATLAAFARYVRRRPGGPTGPLCLNLRALHVEYYDRRKLYVTECFPYIAGRALQELHSFCDGGPDGTTPTDTLELSRVMPLLASTSPNLHYISLRDSREHANREPCSGVGTLLGKLQHLQHLATCLTLEKQQFIHLASMKKLKSLSIALHMLPTESPLPSEGLLNGPGFQTLEALTLDVKHLELATGFLNLLESPSLHRLRITTAMWQSDATIERCFRAAAAQRNVRDLTLCVASAAPGPFAGALPAQCNLNARTIGLLFPLGALQTLSLHALDTARFETDLDDAGVAALAAAWPALRSLALVQGACAARGAPLPPARTTLAALLALRDHCPLLAGLSLSLDTSRFDSGVLAAACAPAGGAGAALRKLNIGARSTPVSNHSVAAQVLHGLFPNLRSIHDGTSVAWDQETSDWQEVNAVLRRLFSPSPLEPPEALDSPPMDVGED
ncbi:hypothetical protein PsYK624_001190 [Phanerochaete sordida]|uniref:F-box domain-containing protein n=1 Tax=Phanerochaete sordida TaxID=48140 RepID=A0A9P3FXB2_9APHY|nr:hypothetical protein PsYK624_001190 [Phanerochaete sordida]